MRMVRDEPELERDAQRYSTQTLPPYRYLPGLHPHPQANPHGHSYGADDEPHPPWLPEKWRTLDGWCHGVDLCNAHFYWESHEAWEALWHAVPRRSAPHRFLQGLIKVSAALLKVRLAMLTGKDIAGAQSLAPAGLELLASIGCERYMGLALGEHIAALHVYFAPLERDELPDICASPLILLDD